MNLILLIEKILSFDYELFFKQLGPFCVIIVLGYIVYETFQYCRISKEYYGCVDVIAFRRRLISDFLGVVIAIVYAILAETDIIEIGWIPATAIFSLMVFQLKDAEKTEKISDSISGALLFISIATPSILTACMYIIALIVFILLSRKHPEEESFHTRQIEYIVALVETLVGWILMFFSRSAFTTFYAVLLVAFNLILPQINPYVQKRLMKTL